MQAVFVFNNIKVDMFRLEDQPFPGFEVLTWEDKTGVPGTLLDLGLDAGYIPLLNPHYDYVKGQIWTTENADNIRELEYFLGVHSGLTVPMKVKAKIDDVPPIFIDATIYRLREIDHKYNIVNDGWWLLKRI